MSDVEQGQTEQFDGIVVMLDADIQALPNFAIQELPSGEVMVALATKPGKYKGLVMDLQYVADLSEHLKMFMELMSAKHYDLILKEARDVNATGT